VLEAVAEEPEVEATEVEVSVAEALAPEEAGLVELG
jgi:hypothetical protein